MSKGSEKDMQMDLKTHDSRHQFYNVNAVVYGLFRQSSRQPLFSTRNCFCLLEEKIIPWRLSIFLSFFFNFSYKVNIKPCKTCGWGWER